MRWLLGVLTLGGCVILGYVAYHLWPRERTHQKDGTDAQPIIPYPHDDPCGNYPHHNLCAAAAPGGKPGFA